MIHDTLENFERYLALHSRFAKVAEFLRTTDLKTLAPGRVEILPDGELFANVDVATGHKREDALVEYHRKYIDIQVPLAITEQMGWMPVAKIPAALAYSEESDAGLGKAIPTSWGTVAPGEFVIFFPQDAHAPCCAEEGAQMPKVIFKVRVK